MLALRRTASRSSSATMTPSAANRPAVMSAIGSPRTHRPLPRQTSDRHQPAHALRDLVEARPFLIRTGLPVGRDAGIDDPRIDRFQVRVIDLQPPFHVGAEILDHDVGLFGQPQECRAGPPRSSGRA